MDHRLAFALLLRASARAGALAAVVTAVWLSCTGRAHAAPGDLGREVLAIEAREGHDSAKVIEHLRPLEASARARGGDDLRIFLAAWGYAHAEVSKPTVADAAVEELTDLADREHNDAARASAWTLRGSLLASTGQVRAGYGWVAGAVPLAERSGDPELRYWVDMTAGDLGAGIGQLDDAIRHYTNAVQDSRESRNVRRESQAFLALAPLHLVTGQAVKAMDDAQRAWQLGEHSTDPTLVVSARVIEALAAEQLGLKDRQRAARAAADAAVHTLPGAIVATSGPMHDAIWMGTELDGVLQLAAYRLAQRDWVNARACANRAIALAQARKDDEREASAKLDLALAEIGAGQLDAGRKLADEAFSNLRQRQDADLVVALHGYADALERAGQHDASMAPLREALLLETNLWRRDRESTVVALQRQSSFEQHQRQMDQLRHDNELQRGELKARATERAFMLALAGAMFMGVVVAALLYRRTRESNRRLAANNAELEFVSTHDKVTGLPNRRAMENHAAALGLTPYCAVTLAPKQFGLIVGSVGRQSGDALLSQIAGRLDAVTQRRDGRLYRLDGVAFGALFRFGGDAAEVDRRVREALEALVSVMEPAFEVGNQDLIVNISVGAARSPEHAPAHHELSRLAELARLQAHRETGSAWVVYDTRIGESQRDKLRLEARMLKALEHGDFELYYQAQRDLPDGSLGGFEALLRWNDHGTMVSPAQFIPLAEETGLIVRIGAWVFRQACLQAKAWADAGHGKPVVAVNISPRQFRHPDFLAQVADTLRETGVDPGQIEIEITEGSVMDDAEASIALLHALKATGMHLAIDDFGTGYASLAYLRRFPLDRLKIDRSFIMQLNQDEAGDTIVRTVIELAHSLGMSVTAEGVETIEQEDALRGWSCDTIQGFLHARPSPVATATQLLLKEQMPAEG